MADAAAAPLNRRQHRWLWRPLSLLGPVLAAILLLFHFDSFDPAELPVHELTGPTAAAAMVNDHVLNGSERIGVGKLPGPEDIAYDPKSGLLYTGCADGWIKRVAVGASDVAGGASDVAVEDWVNTGGRPLGVALGLHQDLIVADTEKGLLKVSQDGVVEVLTDEADGVKFKLTDGVDVAQNGIIYFTDASYKYTLKDAVFDLLEGRPNGRFMSYDPITKQTLVLVRDLYFANGVAVSPNQDFVVFCETSMSRCKKYYISGAKEGTVDTFVEHLPGLPDNIRYDGEGHFWIGIATGITPFWKMSVKYPWVRKGAAILAKYGKRPKTEKNGGAFVVDLEGKPVAHYYDPNLAFVTGGLKIGNFMYLGSLHDSFFTRLHLQTSP